MNLFLSKKSKIHKLSKNLMTAIRQNKKLTLIAVFVLLFGAIGSYMLFSTRAEVPQGTYTNWDWNAPSDGYTSLQHSLTVEAVTPNAPFFWSHQFGFVNGDGGYIGLQSSGSRVNGTQGKTAIFSVFGAAIDATAGSCVMEQGGFDGGTGSGTSCRVPYEWEVGRSYTMRTAKTGADSGGTWWTGWVKDNASGVETKIAEIKVPATWKGHGSWSVMWTEFFGASVPSCDLIPYSRVRFTKPIANNGSATPSSMSNYLNDRITCPSSITNVSNGVVQTNGNPHYQDATIAAAGSTNGITGVYFNNKDFTGTSITRNDTAVNYDWRNGSPDIQLGPDTFSVRWTGKIAVPTSGTYTFHTYSDDGIRLWVNNQKIIDDWTDHPPQENSGSINLTAGQQYEIKVEYYENGGGAVARLLWSGPNVAKQVIPNSAYIITQSSPPPAPSDTQAPVVTISRPSPGETVRGTVQINATAQDNVGVVKMEVYVNGEFVASSNSNSLSATWEPPKAKGKSSKNHTLYVTATDAAGNSSSQTLTFSVR